jgi:hypothetical protein
MQYKLRETARAFALGEVPLEVVRDLARAERLDIQVAEALLRVIADWERGGRVNSPSARNELRERVGQVVPATMVEPEKKKSGSEYAANMYATGLRGQRR